MELSKLKTMEEKELVGEAVRLDQELKQSKKELDAVKAELQARGLQTIEDRNVKVIRYYAPEGNVSVGESQSMDVLNVDKLKAVLPESVWKSKVTEKTETKYTFDRKLEQMLKAVFTGDYTFEYKLDEFLEQMSVHPDEKQKRLLLKKLKGDYLTDRQTLMSVFGCTDEDTPGDYFDVELWYIYKIKNGELIQAFLPEEFLDEAVQEIKKCLIVDSKTSITIDYDKE